MGKKQGIIVTGGAGFIGSHIAKRAIDEGYSVIVLDNLSTGNENNIPRQADFINMDLGIGDSYRRLKKLKCAAVFHLAGQSSGEASFLDPLHDLRSHVMSTFYMLDLAKRNGIRRFVYASSMSVYGDAEYLPVDEGHPVMPKTFYGAGKCSAEAYIKLYQTMGMDTTIFRLFSCYGPGQNLENKLQGMVSIYLSYMLESSPLLIKGSKDRFRDFLYIDDLVDVWMKAFKDPITYGKTYNVGSGKKTKVKELIETIKASMGYRDYQIEYKDGTSGDQFGVVADILKIKKDLRWKPAIGLRTGLDMMVSFERKRHESDECDSVPVLRVT